VGNPREGSTPSSRTTVKQGFEEQLLRKFMENKTEKLPNSCQESRERSLEVGQ